MLMFKLNMRARREGFDGTMLGSKASKEQAGADHGMLQAFV